MCREEEEEMLEDFMIFSKKMESPKEKRESSEHIIKANPVPVTSRIPMYKQICSEQEHR